VKRRRPEILAPAGDPLCLRAAIAAGADAVYLGMARFNARGRAERFRGVTLEACVRAAHAHGVKVYVTLNTLLHDDELAAGLSLAQEALAAGADAAIVQDLGFAALLGERLPELALHGSTQMSIHQPEQAVAVVAALGLRRVILARECSVEEVAAIARRIEPLGADVEVFVHGALCFAYSGPCLMSNLAGRRSANRGICAQNCRFDFTATGPRPPGFLELPVFDRQSASQLISMKDLAAFESIAALAEAGAGSFKIEGRLKGPEYVAEVTRLYRAAVDAWESGVPFHAVEAERAAGRVFSRGFTNGYLEGVLAPAMRGDKRSLEGEPDLVVRAANRKTGVLHVEPRPGHAVEAGQGYRYVHDRYRGGFRVIGVDRAERGAVIARVRFGAEASGRTHRRGAAGRRKPPPPLPVGLACFLNDDPRLEQRVGVLVRDVAIPAGPPRVPVRLVARGAAGERLEVSARTDDGREAHAVSDVPLEVARARGLDAGTLREHLGRFGGTRYELAELDAEGLGAGAFLGFPALHAVRRQLVAELDRAAPAAASGARPIAAPALERPRGAAAVRTALCICVGSPAAAAAAREQGAARIVLEGAAWSGGRLDPAGWQALASLEDPWVRLAPIVHDAAADRAALAALRAHAPHAGVLAGHVGQLQLAAELGLRTAADVYLNADNAHTLLSLQRLGASRVSLSLEIDAREASRAAAGAPVGLELEVVLGGRVFSMLTRQPYGLGPGERLAATSEHGHSYVLEAEGELTTLYEARELIGIEALPLLAGKVDAVRLDLAHRSPEAVGEIARAYAATLAACLDGAAPGEARAAAIGAARAAHERHAPHGSFAGHLIRSSRLQDGDP
jgi:putative protease